MHTTDDDDFDYQEYTRTHPPDPSTFRHGPTALAERAQRARAAGKERVTIRLDDDVLERFRSLANGHGYQSLINQALREWLDAEGIKGLVQAELHQAMTTLTQQAAELRR